MYTEILEKFADLLEFTGEITDNFDYIYEQKQKYQEIVFLCQKFRDIKTYPDLYYVLGFKDGFKIIPVDDFNRNKNNGDNLTVNLFKNIFNSEDSYICFEVNSADNTYKEVSLKDLFKEENKTNIYNEILNRYADFLEYSGKIKADNDYIQNEVEKLKTIFMVNDRLSAIKRNYEIAINEYPVNLGIGRTLLVCDDKGATSLTEGILSSGINVNLIAITNIYHEHRPCICFVIDDINTYREVGIREIMEIIAKEE